MKRTVKFNTLSIKHAKATGGVRLDIRVEGMRGLWLRVLPSGSKRFMYRFGAAGRKMMLEAPAEDLSAVKLEWAALSRQFRNGINPREERDRQRAALRAAREAEAQRKTVAELSTRYLLEHASKKRTGAEDARRLYANILPQLGPMKAEEVTRRHLRELIDAIAQRAPIEANRTLALLRKLFNFALERDLVPGNPTAGITMPGQEQSRQRALHTADELRAFWNLTDPAAGYLRARIAAALRFMLLSGARSNEVCDLRPGEIDMTARTWTLPAERSKNGRAHLLPLTDDMVEIIASQLQGERPLFWTSTAMLEPRMIAKALRVALVAYRDKIEPFTPHDLRRTVETHLAAAGIPAEIRDRVLNHAPRGVAAKYYNVHDYTNEKRLALETWHRRLRSLIEGKRANVRSIGGQP